MKKQTTGGSATLLLALTAALAGGASSVAQAQENNDGGNPTVFVQGGRNKNAYRDGVTATTQNNNLQATLTTDRSQYAPGRAVDLRLSLTNLTNRRFTVAATSVYEYDITVRDDKTNQIVWQWSAGRATRPGALQLILPPNHTHENREFWNQRNNAGQQVSSGVYVVEAAIYPLSVVRAKIYVSDRGGAPGGGGSVGDLPRPGAGGGQQKPGTSYDDNARITATLAANGGGTKAGDTVNLTFTVTNQGANARTYRFNSGQQFEIEARPLNASGPLRQAVWSYSRGRGFTQAFMTIPLGPGQTRTYTTAWKIGNDVPSGDYEIRAYLTPVQGDAGTKASMTLRVVGNGSTSAPSSKFGARYGDNGANRAGSFGQGGNTVRPQVPTSLTPAPVTNLGGVTRVGDAPVTGGAPSVAVEAITGQSAAAWTGRRVIVSGVYRGWKGGAGAPPVRRSDWVIEQNGASLYVVGRAPQVREGERVQITGTVRRARDGRAYIEAD